MEIKGDFLGFSFGDEINNHSSKLGIVRVSGGDRYSENLLPEIKDRTVEVPGLNGQYYFGSNYGTKVIDVEFVFDHLTEYQFRKLRQVFGTTEIKKLIFDERPYKYYMAKIESPIELSYVCFDEPIRDEDNERDGVQRDRENDSIQNESFSDTVVLPANTSITYQLIHEPKGEVTIEGIEDYYEENGVYIFNNNTEAELEITISYQYEVLIPAWKQVTPYKYLARTEHVYKGEGKISFICYFPFAKSVYTELPNAEEESSWAISSGILTAADRQSNAIDVGASLGGSNVGFKIYNPGDMPVGFRLYCPFSTARSIVLEYRHNLEESEGTFLTVVNIPAEESGTDRGFLIDTNTGLIYGVAPTENENEDEYITTRLYNQYVASGYFFKLDTNEPKSNEVMLDTTYLIIKKYNNSGQVVNMNNIGTIKIYYDYLYF